MCYDYLLFLLPLELFFGRVWDWDVQRSLDDRQILQTAGSLNNTIIKIQHFLTTAQTILTKCECWWMHLLYSYDKGLHTCKMLSIAAIFSGKKFEINCSAWLKQSSIWQFNKLSLQLLYESICHVVFPFIIIIVHNALFYCSNYNNCGILGINYNYCGTFLKVMKERDWINV